MKELIHEILNQSIDKIILSNPKSKEYRKIVIRSILLKDKNQKVFKTPLHFKDAGFDVLVCPWEVKKGVYTLAKIANDNNLFGYLETTWHHMYSTNIDLMFYHGGNAAWNGGDIYIDGNYASRRIQVSRHIIDVENDGKIYKYESQGKARYQVKVDMPN